MLSLKSQRGHGHLLLFAALVVAGVGAVGYGVYQKTSVRDVANASVLSANNATAATGGATAKKTKGAALVLYSEQGKYHYAEIELDNSNGKVHHCGKTTGNQTDADFVHVKLKAKGPTQIKCSAIKDKEAYRIYFSANGTLKGRNAFESQDKTTYKIVDVDNGFCTNVHQNASVGSKTPYTNGKCAPEADNITQQTAVMAINSFVNSANSLGAGNVLAEKTTKLTIYPAVHTPGTPSTQQVCSGSVTTYLVEGTDPAGQRLAVKVQPIKVTRQKSPIDDNTYCVVRYQNSVKNLKPSTRYTAFSSYTGNAYMTPANAQISFTTPSTVGKKAAPKATGATSQKTTSKKATH